MDSPSESEPNVACEAYSTYTPTPVRPTASRRLSNFHVLSRPSRQPRLSGFPTEQGHPFSREQTSHRRQSRISQRLTLHDESAGASDPKTPRSTRNHAQPLSSAEIAEIYSSTIKLCQSNKINSRNTWSLNLIDYLPMLVRSNTEQVARTVSFDDTHISPNRQKNSTSDTDFQLAGATLDAGVKIYCSRVDSVHSNAFKVLGGLSQTDNSETCTSETNIHGSDYENEDDADQQKGKPRLNNRPGRSTLESNLEKITTRKLETDLTVDPLFRKMSAAFDEGGASGMLINNLPTGVDGQKIFDSAEFASVLIPEEASDSQDTTYDVSGLLSNPASNDDKLCSKFLRFFQARMGTESEFLPSSLQSGVPESDCPPYSHGSVQETTSSWPSEPSQSLAEFDYDADDLDNAGELRMCIPGETPQMESVETEGGKNQGDEDDVNIFSESFTLTSPDMTQSVTQRGAVDLIDAGMTLLNNDEYDFFSRTTLPTWAGPLHWRFRANDHMGTQKVTKPRKPRSKKAMLLDFSSAAPAIDFDKLFEQGKTKSTYQLTAKVRDNLAEKKVTLPEDLHLSPRWLTELFLKPGISVRRRGSSANDINLADKEQSCGDEWYNLGNDQDDKDSLVGDFTVDNIERNEDNEIDADGFSGVDLIPEPIREEAIDISYAKMAKRVDVRALKIGLWSQLCGETGFADDRTSALSTSVSNENLVEKSDVRDGGVQDMQAIVRDIDKFVPGSSLSDVTLPYIFICLLHLANEKGLRIEEASNADRMDNLTITFDKPDQP